MYWGREAAAVGVDLTDGVGFVVFVVRVWLPVQIWLLRIYACMTPSVHPRGHFAYEPCGAPYLSI